MLPERYEQVQLIGTGANANVYRAYDTAHQCLVAFKWGLPQLSRHVLFRLRWHQEVFLLKNVSSLHIVSILDDGMWKNRPYMVLRFAEKTLEDALQEMQSVQQRLEWLLLLLDALKALHVQGIVHQDINPENILIENNELWLTDFSVARSIDMIRVDQTEVSGTMGWWAPEQQRRANKWVDCWTDLFSWGRIAHYMFQDSPALEYIQDIIIKATAMDCHVRFSSAVFLQTILRERMTGIPPKVLEMKSKSGTRLPPPFSLPIPKITYRQPSNHSPISSNKSLGFGHDVRMEVRRGFERAIQRKKPQMIIVHGLEGVGKKDIIYRETSYLHSEYGARIVSLEYEHFEGVLHLVREWVSPNQEEHKDTVDRVVKYLMMGRKSNVVQKEKEGNALTLWARRNTLIDLEIGILFFLQRLQDYVQEGPVILVLNQPQKSVVAGDGLDLCSLILSEFFISFPILLVASIHESDFELNSKTKVLLSQFEKLGARICIQKPCTKEESALCTSSPMEQEQLYQVCSGHLKHWELIRGEEFKEGDGYIDIVYRTTEAVEKKIMGSTNIFLRALALSKRPLPLYACREQAEELEELFQHRLVIIQGRWVIFCNPLVQDLLRIKAGKNSARMLTDLWRKAEHEDPQERYLSWTEAMVLCGAESTALSILLKTIDQCFRFGRTRLFQEGLTILNRCVLSTSLSVHLRRYHLFRRVEEGVHVSEWKEDFFSCSPEDRETVVQQILQKNWSIDELAHVQSTQLEDGAALVMSGEYFQKQGNLPHAHQLFFRASRALKTRSFLWTFALMRWIEIALYLKKTEGVEDAVLSLLSYARQLSSVRNMACASFVDALWCVYEGRIPEGVIRLRHASAMALLSDQWSLWSRALSHLVALLIDQKKNQEAQGILAYKESLYRMRGGNLAGVRLERWFLLRDVVEEVEEDPKDEELTVLWMLQKLIQQKEGVYWKTLKEKVFQSMNPFVPRFIQELGDDILSAQEKEEILKQISFEMC